MSPRSFVCPRHKSNGDLRSRTGLQGGQAIVRESTEGPVTKVRTGISIFVNQISTKPSPRQ